MELVRALAEAGGPAAAPRHHARLGELLLAELAHGAGELTRPRSGYDRPIVVAFGHADGHLAAVLPIDASVRADPERAAERGWLLAAATVGALVEVAEDPGALEAGSLAGEWLVLTLATKLADPDLAPLALEEHLAGVDRLRVQGVAMPGALLEPDDPRAPVGAHHRLRVASAVARLGGRPADEASLEEHADAVVAMLGEDPSEGSLRPHDDPDPSRRVARRILQRLAGMGKWGGYHTDVAHLSRGFAGNERALAQDVGEALVAAGLLVEKTSVGQRHVYLNPRRAADVYALVDHGLAPPGLVLP